MSIRRLIPRLEGAGWGVAGMDFEVGKMVMVEEGKAVMAGWGRADDVIGERKVIARLRWGKGD
jgi:hypothetical protein